MTMGSDHPLKTLLKECVEFVLGCAAITFAASVFMGAIYLGSQEGNRDCWREAAHTVDCDLFAPCRQVNGHDRIIDLELNYAKRHAECRADWTPAKRREAEIYWATDGKDQ